MRRNTELETWEELSQKAQDYWNKHEKEIVGQAKENEAKEILKALPATLANGHVLWCRNGAVCHEATPCSELACKYKTALNDLANGASRCQMFQVTRQSQRGWHDAYHVDIYGKPEGCR